MDPSICGRYVLKSAPRAIRAQFDIVDEHWGETSRREEWRPRFNLAPSQVAPVVRLIEGKRHIDLLRWGLIPSWAEDPSISMKLINARSETAATKPAFRAAFRSHRCIVPADGFYEWQHLASGKQPFYIHRKDGQLLAMAGLWEHWTPPGTQDSVQTFTILTTEANDWMRQIHDRMPLALEGDEVGTWLNPETKTEDLQRLMRPLGEDQLAAYPVSKAVGNVHHDQPALVEPI